LELSGEGGALISGVTTLAYRVLITKDPETGSVVTEIQGLIWSVFLPFPSTLCKRDISHEFPVAQASSCLLPSGLGAARPSRMLKSLSPRLF
jgi:hypothetical protein